MLRLYKPKTTPHSVLIVLRAIVPLLVAATITSCAKPDESFVPPQKHTPLRDLADRLDLLVGTAANYQAISDDAEYRLLIAKEFNSVTPENSFKWSHTEANYQDYDWKQADKIAEFARNNALSIRGHTLVWPNTFSDSAFNALPDYVKQSPTPDVMQTYIDDHIEAVVTRYANIVDRWDVINEPLQLIGGKPDSNILYNTLGESWMVRALEQTRALDPSSDLYINENLSERPGQKHRALVALVKRLLAANAPLDGIGLQSHFVIGGVSYSGLKQVMKDWEDLGLKVAITELDMVNYGNHKLFAKNYATIYQVCLEAPNCNEVTVWGASDQHSWLNSFFGTGSLPLLFDADYKPKRNYFAVNDMLTSFLDTED